MLKWKIKHNGMKIYKMKWYRKWRRSLWKAIKVEKAVKIKQVISWKLPASRVMSLAINSLPQGWETPFLTIKPVWMCPRCISFVINFRRRIDPLLLIQLAGIIVIQNIVVELSKYTRQMPWILSDQKSCVIVFVMPNEYIIEFLDFMSHRPSSLVD